MKYFLNPLNFSQHIRDFIYHKNLFNTNAKFLISIDRTTYRQVNNTLKNKTHILPNLYLPTKLSKISSEDLGIKWQLGTPRIEVQPDGRRG